MLVIDEPRHLILDEYAKVPASELAQRLDEVRSRFGATARILVDGAAVD